MSIMVTHFSPKVLNFVFCSQIFAPACITRLRCAYCITTTKNVLYAIYNKCSKIQYIGRKKEESTGNFDHVTQFLALQLLRRLTVTNDFVN